MVFYGSFVFRDGIVLPSVETEWRVGELRVLCIIKLRFSAKQNTQRPPSDPTHRLDEQ